MRSMRVTWVLLSACFIFHHCVCSDDGADDGTGVAADKTTTLIPTTTIIPTTTPIPTDKTTTPIPTDKITTTKPTDQITTTKPADETTTTIPTTTTIISTTSAFVSPHVMGSGSVGTSTKPPASPAAIGHGTLPFDTRSVAVATQAAATNKPSISSAGAATVSMAPDGRLDSPDSEGSSTITTASTAVKETGKDSTSAAGHSTIINKDGEGVEYSTENVSTSAIGTPQDATTTTITTTETQTNTFLFSLNDGREREDEKELALVCRRLMEDMHAGNCSLTWRTHNGKPQFDNVEIGGKVKTSLANQYYEEITKKSSDNTTLIAILASCGALLAMIIGLAIYASHHRKPFNENQQHLTEELHTVENGYHDNPTLEVMEVQPEMQEKKVALNGEFNDSWIVPIDNLLKEELADEEDTHL